MLSRGLRLFLSVIFLASFSNQPSLAQGVAGAVCKPVSQRSQEVGCWIMADEPIGQLKKSPVFWHLDNYATRFSAEADK